MDGLIYGNIREQCEEIRCSVNSWSGLEKGLVDIGQEHFQGWLSGVTFCKVSGFQEVKYYGEVYCLSGISDGNSLIVFLLWGRATQLLILSFELQVIQSQIFTLLLEAVYIIWGLLAVALL